MITAPARRSRATIVASVRPRDAFQQRLQHRLGGELAAPDAPGHADETQVVDVTGRRALRHGQRHGTRSLPRFRRAIASSVLTTSAKNRPTMLASVALWAASSKVALPS